VLRNEQGFTLLDLITGIIIMAILSLAVAPQINGILSSFRLGGATKVVWGDLHKARLTAIKEGRTMRVDFTSNSYNIVRVDTDEIVSRRMLSIDYQGVDLPPFIRPVAMLGLPTEVDHAPPPGPQ
jgi:Tfp pilus assembly protein FimT